MKKTVSLITGMILSLVFEISVHFPVMDENIPLATVEHVPEKGVSMLLECLRRTMAGGYGILCGALALIIAMYMMRQGK